jgi:AcrR family transcriptional regulator
MVTMHPMLAPVNTVGMVAANNGAACVTTLQLSANDWLDQGLRTLTQSGFTALKAEPLAKAMGVSRGSFYWHFADVGAFHAALLKRWREVTTEQIIASLERSPAGEIPMNVLLRRAFGGSRLRVEVAVRSWATVDPAARAAVQAIDRRRLSYMESLCAAQGYSPAVAQARAQILYWAFLGFTLSDKPLSKSRQDGILAELIRIANAPT